MEWARSALFRQAHGLTHLILQEVEITPDTLVSIIPWTKLKSLHLERIAIRSASVLQVLSLTPALSLISIVPRRSLEPSEDHLGEDITLSHLESLHLDFSHDDESLRELVSHLKAPQLRRLQLTTVDSNDLKSINSFIGHSLPLSRPSLVSLILAPMSAKQSATTPIFLIWCNDYPVCAVCA